jgi:hypothetical protein
MANVSLEKANDDTLRFEYQEVSKSHQAIADVRARLWGLLPLASGTGIFLLLSGKAPTNVPALLVPTGLFGAAVTFGLYLYEKRGMKECLLLRRRGATLECQLGISRDVARFRNNPVGFVGPQGAGPIVYFAVIAAWLFVAAHGASVAIARTPRSQSHLDLEFGVAIVAVYLMTVGIAAALAFRRPRAESEDCHSATRSKPMDSSSEDGLLRDEDKRWAFWIILVTGGFLFIVLSYAMPRWMLEAHLGVTRSNVEDISNALVGFFTLIVPVLIGSDAHVRHGKLSRQAKV